MIEARMAPRIGPNNGMRKKLVAKASRPNTSKEKNLGARSRAGLIAPLK